VVVSTLWRARRLFTSDLAEKEPELHQFSGVTTASAAIIFAVATLPASSTTFQIRLTPEVNIYVKF
jgi:hypothetical protein